MATTLGQMSIGSLVTIQESSGPAQFYVAYHGYKNAVSSNQNNLVLFIRKGYYDTFVDSNKGYVGLGESYNWNTSVAYSHANNYYNNILTDDIKNNIVNFSYYGPKTTNGNFNASIYQQKVFVPLYKMLDAGYGISKNDNIFPMLNLYGYGSPTPESINAQLAKTIISENVQNITTAVQVMECVPISSFLQSSNNSTPYLGGYERIYNNLIYCRTWNSSITCKFLPCFCLPNTIKVSDSGELYVGPYDTTFTNVPNLAMQGQPITITWNAANEATSYSLQRSTNGGTSWETVYTGANLTFTETVGEWTQLQYQVAAVNADGTSPYNGSGAIEVITSQVLVISGSDQDLGELVNDIPYTVSTNTGHQITINRTVNGVSVAQRTVESGFSYTIPVIDLPTGNGTIVIQASTTTTGSEPYSTTRTWQYNKQAITFSNDGGISELTENNAIVWPATIMEAVKTYDFMGGTLDKTLIDIFNTLGELNDDITSNQAVATKFVIGRYTGTGKYGSGAPNSLTFERKPIYLFIWKTRGEYYAMFPCYALSSSFQENGYITFENSGNETRDCYARVEGNSIYWYANTFIMNQMNDSNQSYAYFALLE